MYNHAHVFSFAFLYENSDHLCASYPYAPTHSKHLERLKTISKSQSLLFTDLLGRQVRHSFLNMNIENEHRLLFLLWIQAQKLRSDRAGEQK